MVHVSHQVRLKNCLDQTHSQYADAMDINSETLRRKSKIQEVKKDLEKSLDLLWRDLKKVNI